MAAITVSIEPRAVIRITGQFGFCFFRGHQHVDAGAIVDVDIRNHQRIPAICASRAMASCVLETASTREAFHLEEGYDGGSYAGVVFDQQNRFAL